MNPQDAIATVKKSSKVKFDATIELHATVKKQGLSVNVTLPFSFGKTKKIEIADDKTVEKLKAGKIDFDVLLSTPEMMPKLVVFAKLLGPKGLMPNPKNGTVIKTEKDASKFSAASMTVKTEKDAPLIHTVIGKHSQKDEELLKNLETILEALGKNQVIKAVLSSTMGPAVKLTITD